MNANTLPAPRALTGRLASDDQIPALVAASGGTANRDDEAGTVIVTLPKGTELFRAIRKGGPGEPWIVIYNRDCYCPDNDGQVHRIAICVGANGSAYNRAAVIDPQGARRIVPVDLLPLAAGSDAWMREIRVKCVDCRKPVRAGDMECQLCPTCYEKAEQENEAQDA